MAVLQHECGVAAVYVLPGFMPQSRLLPQGDPNLATSFYVEHGASTRVAGGIYGPFSIAP